MSSKRRELFRRFHKCATIGHGECRCDQSLDIEPDVRQQFFSFTMFDKPIGNPQALHVTGRNPVRISRFEHGGTEATTDRIFFNRDHKSGLVDRSIQGRAVDRFGKAGINHTDIKPLFSQAFCSGHTGGEQRTEGNEHSIDTPFQDFGLAVFDWRFLSLNSFDVRFRVTNRGRPIMRQRKFEHGGDIEFVTGIAAPEPPAIVLAGMALGGVICGRSLLRKRQKPSKETT